MAVTKYFYDGDTVFQEYDGVGNTLAEYTSTGEGYGDLLSVYDGTSERYYEPDALGSTDALTDQSQTVVDRWRYRAFGSATQTVGTDSTPFTWVGRLGYYADDATDLYQLGNGTRYYDPAVAQFLSQDPIGFAGGDPNLCRYVSNRPISLSDPLGLRPVTESEFYQALDLDLLTGALGKLVSDDLICPLYDSEIKILLDILFKWNSFDIFVPRTSTRLKIVAKLLLCAAHARTRSGWASVVACGQISNKIAAAIPNLDAARYPIRKSAFDNIMKQLKTASQFGCFCGALSLIKNALAKEKEPEKVRMLENILKEPATVHWSKWHCCQ